MSYTLEDPVAIREGHILANCETCNADILMTLPDFKEAWRDADESTRIFWFCKDCADDYKRKKARGSAHEE